MNNEIRRDVAELVHRAVNSHFKTYVYPKVISTLGPVTRLGILNVVLALLRNLPKQ